MCYQCETNPIHGVHMTLSPLDIAAGRKTIPLPESWVELEKQGFHEDILLRAYAHLLWSMRASEKTQNPDITHNARVFLASLGKGFLQPFSRKKFEPTQGDRYYTLKTQSLDAISEMSELFGNRVSAVVWNSFAHLATRE